MNRKKILICLNGQDDSLLESAFIERHMPHARNLVMKLQLECIINEETEEVDYRSNGKAVVAQTNGRSHAISDLLPANQDVHELGKILSSNRRQSVVSSSVKELITESHYSDLILIRSSNYHASCMYYGQQKTMEELLKKAGCPVMIVPEDNAAIEQMLLIFDGSSSAFNAIRTLKMTLPLVCHSVPITVLISCNRVTDHFSSNEEKLLIEYLRLHFRDVGVHKVCEESVHTLQFAIDPTQRLMMVINEHEQQIPDYITGELELLKQAQDYRHFQFVINANR
jgi:hypothetical protein